MNRKPLHRRHICDIPLAAAVVVATITCAPSTAVARQDPGPRVEWARASWDSTPFRCPVERTGSQVVRCDNLSGAGVPAPPGIPQQS
jgi:hypothetical protein